MIYGLDKLISRETGLDVFVAEDAVYCVAKGTGMSLDYMEQFQQSGYRKN